MSQTANTDCLYTSVKNVSGAARTFGYLRERGMRLAANEVATVPGDLVGRLGATTSKRKFKALERSLTTNESLQIISTPALFLFDPVHDRVRQVTLYNEQLGVVDPCWDASGSSDFSDAGEV